MHERDLGQLTLGRPREPERLTQPDPPLHRETLSLSLNVSLKMNMAELVREQMQRVRERKRVTRPARMQQHIADRRPDHRDPAPNVSLPVPVSWQGHAHNRRLNTDRGCGPIQCRLSSMSATNHDDGKTESHQRPDNTGHNTATVAAGLLHD